MRLASTVSRRRRDRHHCAARVATVVVVLIGGALLIAGCGGGSSAPGVANLKKHEYDEQHRLGRPLGAGRQVRRVHAIARRVRLPRPDPGTSAFPPVAGIEKTPGFGSAEAACRRYLPTAPSAAGFSDTQINRMQTEALAMARCLRSHGVPNFPDPKYTAEPGGSLDLTFARSTCKLDETSPTFLAAVKLCPSGLGGNFALSFIRAQQEYGAACAQ